MAIQRPSVLIESLVTNPLTVDVKYAWGNRNGSKLGVPSGKTIRVPYDVYTESDAASRLNLTADLIHGRVKLSYVTNGVDAVRVDKATAPSVIAAPALPAPTQDYKALEQPKVMSMEESVAGPSANSSLANDYDAIGRTGSIETAKPERVSPMDEQPNTRYDAQQISLDDWDGQLAKDQADFEAAQPAPELAPEDKQLAEERQAKRAKKGRR